MDNNEIFRDWALVGSLEEDIIQLQLSRDVLPATVHLISGVILELRTGKEGKGYRCSGYFISFNETGGISVHLTGDVVTCELREFYRIDMFLPLRYDVASTDNMDHVLAEWRSRRRNNLAIEQERKEQYEYKRKEHLLRVPTGELEEDPEPAQVIEEYNPIDESWNTINGFAVNISAGGFKFVTADPLAVEDLIFFEILIPITPPRVMETVGKVVFKKPHGGEDFYELAIQFMFIDERDRDALVKHISNIETLRIRLLRQVPLISSSGEDKVPNIKNGLLVAGLFVLVFIGLFFVYSYFIGSSDEIQNSFQDSLKSLFPK